jgi:hypothetical protein
MPEYSGYKGTAPIDFAGIARQGVSDIINARAADEKKATDASALKKKNDDSFNEEYDEAATAMSTSVGTTPDKEFNDLVFEANDKGRVMQTNLYNNAQSPADQAYAKRIFGKMTRELGNWKIFRDNIAEVTKINTERITEGTSSVLEQEEMAWRGKALNFNDKHASWSPNGDLLFNTVDVDGNVTESLTASQLVGNVQNFLVDKHDLSDVTKSIVDSGGTYKIQEGSTTITSLTESPNYDKWMNRQIRAATNSNDPKTIAAIVLDNNLELDYQMKTGGKESVSLYSGIYYSDDQKTTKVEKQLQEIMEDEGREFSEEEQEELRSEIGGLMIPVNGSGSGENNYSVNSKHKDLVRSAIEKDVAIKLGYTETKKKDSTNGSERNKGKEYKNGYTSTINAMNGDFSGLNNNYVYKKTSNGIAIYKRFTTEGFDLTEQIITGTGAYKPIVTTNNPKQLSVYAFGGSQDAAMNKWDKANKIYGGSNSNNSSGGELD